MRSEIFSQTSQSISELEIREIEKNLNIIIPAEVREHYLMNNGGVPNFRYWFVDETIWHRIRKFLPMKYPVGGRTIETVYRMGIEKGYLIPGLVPFADDDGGNYFCFDEEARVFFYAIDAWDDSISYDANKLQISEQLCSSFEKFVDGLAPCLGDDQGA